MPPSSTRTAIYSLPSYRDTNPSIQRHTSPDKMPAKMQASPTAAQSKLLLSQPAGQSNAPDRQIDLKRRNLAADSMHRTTPEIGGCR